MRKVGVRVATGGGALGRRSPSGWRDEIVAFLMFPVFLDGPSYPLHRDSACPFNFTSVVSAGATHASIFEMNNDCLW